MLYKLTNAFKEKDLIRILKFSAEIGHYISDAHVPLHATENYNGQFTNQKEFMAFGNPGFQNYFSTIMIL